MGEQPWLNEANVQVKCPECSADITVRINLLTYEHKVLTEPKASFGDRMKLISVFKDLKGYNRIPTWDAQNRGRALKAAGRILYFFRKLEDPVGVSIECLNETFSRAQKEGWTDRYQIETVLKLASDWLLAKLK